MIEVSQISKSFGEVQALDNVSFSVETGKIVGFLGANGAGKTTTMDILAGCIGADIGTAKVAGFDVSEDPIEAKSKLGYLPDEPPLHGDMVVSDFISYVARLRRIPSSDIAKRVDETIDQLSLGEVRNRLVGNLSKGYKQRVGLAQAIVHNPDVLILDEPTEGLDPNQIAHIRELIRSLAGNHTILLSSHILSEVQNTCDYIVIIHEGKILKQGTYNELVSALEGSTTFELQVRGAAGKVVGGIKELAGVVSASLVEDNANAIDILVGKDADEMILDQIAKLVIESGEGLRAVRQKGKSLEEVFLQLTK